MSNYGEIVYKRFVISVIELLSEHFELEQSKALANKIGLEVLKWSIKAAEDADITYNWKSPQFCTIYGNKCYIILQHLDVKSRVGDTTVIDALKSGVSINEILTWPMYKLAPKASQKVRDLINQQSNVEVHMKTTKMHNCPSCKHNEAWYNVQQTRSADEPATVMLCCVKCNREWRL